MSVDKLGRDLGSLSLKGSVSAPEMGETRYKIIILDDDPIHLKMSERSVRSVIGKFFDKNPGLGERKSSVDYIVAPGTREVLPMLLELTPAQRRRCSVITDNQMSRGIDSSDVDGADLIALVKKEAAADADVTHGVSFLLRSGDHFSSGDLARIGLEEDQFLPKPDSSIKDYRKLARKRIRKALKPTGIFSKKGI